MNEDLIFIIIDLICYALPLVLIFYCLLKYISILEDKIDDYFDTIINLYENLRFDYQDIKDEIKNK